MLPQTHTARIAALEQRIAFLRRLTVYAGVVAGGLIVLGLTLVGRNTGFDLGFADKVVLPLRLMLGETSSSVEMANTALVARWQGIVLGAVLNLAFLGPLQDWLQRSARLDRMPAMLFRLGAALIGSVMVLTPWIMCWALALHVYRRSVKSGAAPGLATWIRSMFGAAGLLMFAIAPPMALLITVLGGMDFAGQRELLVTSTAQIHKIPEDQGDAIGRDQLRYVKAQAFWIDRHPDLMVAQLAAMEGAWHPRLRIDRARLGFMLAESGDRLTDAQRSRLQAMGTDRTMYDLPRLARIGLVAAGGAVALLAGLLAMLLRRRSDARDRFESLIEVTSLRSRRIGGPDAVPA